MTDSYTSFDLSFENFPMYLSAINIPGEQICVYRASKTNPSTPTHPRFFGEFNVANLYINSPSGAGNPIWKCTFNKTSLLDIRMMRNMVVEALLQMDERKFNENVIFGNQRKETFRYYVEIFMRAYGLRPMWERGLGAKNLIEPFQNFGLRSSIFDQDDVAVALLKYIFYPEFAGYIAPKFITQLEPSKINFHNEICLFNPSECFKTCEKKGASSSEKRVDELKQLRVGGEPRLNLKPFKSLKSLNIDKSFNLSILPNIENLQTESEPSEHTTNVQNKTESIKIFTGRFEKEETGDSDDTMDEYLTAFEFDDNFRELAKHVRAKLIYKNN